MARQKGRIRPGRRAPRLPHEPEVVPRRRRPQPIRRRRPLRLGARLRTLLGSSSDVVRQSLVSLTLNSSTSLVAGAVLGSITNTFERLPGLLVLVPAAIGLRGNVFSALGNRLSTASHLGNLRLTIRRQTLMGQNIAASMILTLFLSLLLAIVAKVVAVALGVMHTVSVLDLALISIVGGALASIVVLVATIVLAAGSVRYGWDLDNLTAPLVSTLGDVLTLPALWLASLMVDVRVVSQVLGTVVVVLVTVLFVAAWRSGEDMLRRIVRESTPILFAAACLSTMAGITIEKRLSTFATYPALLILFPAFISSAGALGGILSSRLSTKLHLGLMSPASFPSRDARADGYLILLLGVPVYVFNAVGAHFTARLLGEASPGIMQMTVVSLLGGVVAVLFVLAVAYYGTIAAVRLGADPDTYGIPLVTSSVDFVGAVALIVVIVSVGIT